MTRPEFPHEQTLDAHVQAACRLIGRSTVHAARSRGHQGQTGHGAGKWEASRNADGAPPRWESLGQMVEWAYHTRDLTARAVR